MIKYDIYLLFAEIATGQIYYEQQPDQPLISAIKD